MSAEQRGSARSVLLAVCALCVCVFTGLAVTRAARSSSGPAHLVRTDPARPAELPGRLARLSRSVDSTPDLNSDQVSSSVDPGTDAADSATTEVTPDVTPEMNPKAIPELTTEVTPELTTEVTPEFTPEVTSEVTPEVTPKSTDALAPADLVSDTLRHVFIAVKTSGQFHRERLPPILDTWFTTARNQTWFFSDVDDTELQQRTGGHVINTNCSSSHRRDALCCKMAVEYDTFLASGKKWFCHFDDDNYVSAVRLGELLSGYSPQQDWYLGKNSIRAPLQIMDRDRPGERISFWFATGGAGFCLSRALALKMSPIASGGRFMRVGDKIRLPDDVTVGYIVEHVLKVPLSVVDQFHSHLEQMKFIRPDDLSQQISFSYSQYPDEPNVVNLDTFDEQKDPTRFYSLHCLFYPSASFCRR